MDTKALRQKILDLAIRGKLVPQDPNDEPASVLLDRIREQKRQMVKEGKLKARDIKNDSVIYVGEDNLHYEKFQDGTVKCIENEIPFELPDGWEWSKINTIAFVTKLAGFEYTKNIAPNLCENGVPLFKGKNVQNSTIIYEFDSYIPESISDELQRSQITRKCILTPYVGTIGNIGIHSQPGKYHLGSNVGKIELYNSNAMILEEYVVAYLQSKYGYQQLTKHMKATAQASISIEAIRDVYLPIPPANEQQRICDMLSHALELIYCVENSKLDIKKLISDTKSKILDLAIRGKLVPQDPNDEPASVLLERIRAEKEELIKQGKIKRDKKESVIFKGDDNSYYEKVAGSNTKCIDDEVPFGLPESWTYEKLGNICSVARGSSPRPIEDYLTEDENGLNWIKIGDTEQGGKYIFTTKEKIRPEGMSTTRYVHNGDFLLTNSMSFGRPYILKTDGCIHDGWLVIGNIEAIFYQDYLYYMLSSSVMYDSLSLLASGSTVKNLKSDSVKSLIVPIPPRREQEFIAKRIEMFFTIIESIEKSLS